MDAQTTEEVSHSAVLLIAHGSRRQSANDDLVQLAEMLRQQSQYEIVEHAFLELAEPTIPQGLQNCLRARDLVAQPLKVLMMPYFLSAGSHVSDDLERFRSEFVRDFPDVECVLCPPIGLHPMIVDIVRDRLIEGDSAL